MKSGSAILGKLISETMIEITQEEFEINFESYIDQVEKYQTVFLIRTPDGSAIALAPIDDSVKEILSNLPQKDYVTEITT